MRRRTLFESHRFGKFVPGYAGDDLIDHENPHGLRFSV
jgi:hypothetical protein